MQHSFALWPGRIKVKPEDFQVVEETTLRPAGAGAYRLYRLTKVGWGTEELVRHLARRLDLPRGAFAYGGRKDRAALTSQHVTIRGRRDRSLVGDRFELQSLGFVDRPMGPDAIAANHFTVVVRHLAAACEADLLANFAESRRLGVPNYFDDQRFRSFSQFRTFPAALLVRGEWEAALRLLLTSPAPREPRHEKQRRARLEHSWGNWHECLALTRSSHQRRALERLLQGGAASALAELPREELSLLLAAYQSHLWNRALAMAVRARCQAWVELPGLAGAYAFPAPGGGCAAAVGDLVIPTPGPRLAAASPEGIAVMQQVLDEEGITPVQLTLRPLRNAFMKSTPRSALLVPGAPALEWLPAASSNSATATARLTFSLPAGSYATMVVRALLLRRSSFPAAPAGEVGRHHYQR